MHQFIHYYLHHNRADQRETYLKISATADKTVDTKEEALRATTKHTTATHTAISKNITHRNSFTINNQHTHRTSSYHGVPQEGRALLLASLVTKPLRVLSLRVTIPHAHKAFASRSLVISYHQPIAPSARTTTKPPKLGNRMDSTAQEGRPTGCQVNLAPLGAPLRSAPTGD